ncbi:S24 family peptidase [Deinococcus radiomollis]|uniref:LexA family protein n=1 Tax=Deinococcus radiomollis TaxID=468916 RepID=UPI0038915041
MDNENIPSLTRRQQDVLTEIARLDTANEAITTARLGEQLGMPRQNVRSYLLPLRDLNLILYIAGERQNAVIRLTEQGRTLITPPTGLPTPAHALAFPILGDVAAGQPGWAEEHIEGYAARLQDILDLHEGDFLLRVRGDSMIGVGIYPGDLVAIHPTTDEPHSGEITLVSVPGDDTATLKRWQRHNGTVSLHSENPDYPVMTFKVEDIQIQGCLVGHIGTGRSRRTGSNGHG